MILQNRFLFGLLLCSLASLPALGCADPASREQSSVAAPAPIARPTNDLLGPTCPRGPAEGCEMAVLEGDPRIEGLFTARIRVAAGFSVPAHTHLEDERVTVINGRVAVGFGIDVIESSACSFGQADYYVNPRGIVHEIWVQAPTVIQVTGFGPWIVNPVDAGNWPSQADSIVRTPGRILRRRARSAITP